ncbi:Polygalacturonase 1 [Recurvomyces mirabilis]|uniref:endo-polygalacturonase n=1 Tax=Recurvomyces mirabilis TaxID=574656 RepID=A0AAE0TRF7_9PEZI|nr:Polygalacturonase 1 [Recurvomyces mirabilis]KAK5151608.1 Polygalacturonase 1 [Recurvomyces mirabilis]
MQYTTSTLALALALFGGSALATPIQVEERASTSCTFSGSTGAAAVAKSKTSCSAIVLSSLVVPAGTTLDLTGLKQGTTVTFQGTTTFGYKEWAGPLVSVSGTDISVTGASGAILDGGGAKYWDGQGSNGGKTKPKFFYAHNMIGKSSINSLNIKNTPVQVYSVNGADGLTINGGTIDNSAGDAGGGHNTDCFDVGSITGLTISGITCKNQDDCLAINSGTDITFTGGTCSGGHGLSIGSVGGRSDNTVSGVTIENSSISNSQNGVRIKTVSGATGSVKGVTYKNIKLSGITKYGVVIEQDYENGSPTGTPTSGVPITGLTLNGITGSVTSSATEVQILCAACSGWTWSGVSVTGGKKSSSCKGVPSGASC